ncbi:progranulin-like [Stegodyphus dumicola]|uniref:progranulin-like n=1 Tax=Stegodyphus dumicola TaxID=202533 RepID=UPI0015AA4358|nr:progranulin-like [Stegodyphus dumicola]
MWFLFVALLPLVISGKDVCPDGTLCPEGKVCCPESDAKFGCCNSDLTMGSFDVEQQHVMGAPSIIAENATFPNRWCNCPRGTCCDNFCCQLQAAQCCRNPSKCCGNGWICCGNGQWCCRWNQICSAAYGFCLNK